MARSAAAAAAKVREVPWGDLSYIPDPKGREPWEVVAEAEERALRLASSAAGRRTHPPCPVLIGFTPTWTTSVVHYKPGAGEPCPGCGSLTTDRACAVTLRPNETCVVCGVSQAAPIQWPLQAPLRARVRTRRLRGGTG